MDQDEFSPETCIAIAERTPEIWDVLHPRSSTAQPPKSGAAPESWGAHVGLRLVDSHSKIPDWSASLFAEYYNELSLPRFVEPGRGVVVDEVWNYRFYLGLLCALACLEANKTQAPTDGWVHKAFQTFKAVTRHATTPGTDA